MTFGLFGFGQEQHERVWVYRFGHVEWTKDCDGRLIKRSEYGKENSAHGWEIDHIVPQAVGGGNELNNLRPRHCTGNALAGALLGNALRSLPEEKPTGLINTLANWKPPGGAR